MFLLFDSEKRWKEARPKPPNILHVLSDITSHLLCFRAICMHNAYLHLFSCVNYIWFAEWWQIFANYLIREYPGFFCLPYFGSKRRIHILLSGIQLDFKADKIGLVDFEGTNFDSSCKTISFWLLQLFYIETLVEFHENGILNQVCNLSLVHFLLHSREQVLQRTLKNHFDLVMVSCEVSYF